MLPGAPGIDPAAAYNRFLRTGEWPPEPPASGGAWSDIPPQFWQQMRPPPPPTPPGILEILFRTLFGGG